LAFELFLKFLLASWLSILFPFPCPFIPRSGPK
jgi:hypothetical protein